MRLEIETYTFFLVYSGELYLSELLNAPVLSSVKAMGMRELMSSTSIALEFAVGCPIVLAIYKSGSKTKQLQTLDLKPINFKNSSYSLYSVLETNILIQSKERKFLSHHLQKEQFSLNYEPSKS